MARDVLINVAELLRQPANRMPVHVRVPVEEIAPDGLRVVDARIAPESEVTVDLELESLSDGLVVTGRVGAPWIAECRRCLRPVEGGLEIELREVFQTGSGPDDDTFPLTGEQVDLAPMLREALSLELPLAPLCAETCAGLCPNCGADRNDGGCTCTTAPADPRWAALEALRDQLPGGPT